MDEKPKRPLHTTPVRFLAALLLVVSAAYIAGYFATSQEIQGGQFLHGRLFNAKWECTVYCAALRIEAAARGETLVLYYADRGGVHVFDIEPH